MRVAYYAAMMAVMKQDHTSTPSANLHIQIWKGSATAFVRFIQIHQAGDQPLATMGHAALTTLRACIPGIEMRCILLSFLVMHYLK
jgi:hypothetical protein